jgi:hypothetical protein
LNVTTSSTWSCDTNVGSISNTGILTPATVSSNATGLVYASYTSNGATVNTQYSVTVHPAANTLYPYYGVADMNATKNSAFILALASRGSNSSRVVPSFSLNSGSAGSTLKGYFASPVSYGFVTFTDLANGLQGGWDGAKNNPTNMSMLGPITISVPVNGVNIDFYLYGNDWPGLGTITWGTS